MVVQSQLAAVKHTQRFLKYANFKRAAGAVDGNFLPTLSDIALNVVKQTFKKYPRMTLTTVPERFERRLGRLLGAMPYPGESDTFKKFRYNVLHSQGWYQLIRGMIIPRKRESVLEDIVEVDN